MERPLRPWVRGLKGLLMALLAAMARSHGGPGVGTALVGVPGEPRR
ncbi:hypothetical protein [Stutzerimonas azotifigens]|uniref:Uncharacterized protein n=1 Tax=Stutzerimonas azotifigens TaxID=291995 RepID=A0ABR5Z5C8_9GAMM|nr:hypothetical protein [Stutzerimonas azotifigens]MBA1275359.1 hypothetical protein [Stutzerimonas azotifigens]